MIKSIIATASLYLFLPLIAFSAPLKDFTAFPKDFTAKYKLYHNGLYVGESSRQLITNKDLLTFTSVTETAGLAAIFFSITINETSQLQLKNKKLNFISYLYEEKKKDKNETYQINLDKPQQIYNSHTKKHYPLTADLQDTLGFTVAIMHDMQQGMREIKYTIAEKDKLKTYTLRFIKEEKLPINNGAINTIKMEHYDPQSNFRFTFWCAESMGFLPIRIQNINHKGDVNLFNLSHFNEQAIYLNLEDENSN
jgi:hypothetical protein